MENKTISITLTQEQARSVIRLIDQRAADRAVPLGYADRDDAIDELGYQITARSYAYFPGFSILEQPTDFGAMTREADKLFKSVETSGWDER
jgi:hypothetical protein